MAQVSICNTQIWSRPPQFFLAAARSPSPSFAAAVPNKRPVLLASLPSSLPSLFFSSSPMLSPLMADQHGPSGPAPAALSNHGASEGLKADETGFGGGGDDDSHKGSGGRGGDGGNNGDGHYDGDDARDAARKQNSFFAWYMVLLNDHPIATKAVTSALLTLIGDVFCQLVIEKEDTINWKRTSIFTSLGLFLVGPTLHFWYFNLSKLVPGPGTVKAGLRLLLDQFLFSPVFIGVFFSALLTLEGRTPDIVPKLRQDWPSAVVANWKIWIPFQFLNFLLVPQQLQVLAANIISLAWNVYLSFATHTAVISPSERK